MKDALGHGSDPRFAARTPTLADASRPGMRLPVNRQPMPSDSIDTMRTVAGLRRQLQSAGPGHGSALMQGIKNFLGG
jgi:hypothetical protein